MVKLPYHRLQTELAGMIARLPADTRLPSEPDLAHQLGVSRATLREALRSFEGQGLIRRRQGVGTFVVSQASVINSGLEVLESIETMALRSNLSVKMGELQVQQEEATEAAAGELNIKPGHPIIHISRVIITDRHPIAYLVDTLPAEVLSVSDLTNGFSGSVLDLLLQQGDPKLVQSKTEIRALGAPEDIADIMQIHPKDVLLQFSAHLYSEEARIVDHSISYFLPGYFRFHVVRRVGLQKRQDPY